LVDEKASPISLLRLPKSIVFVFCLLDVTTEREDMLTFLARKLMGICLRVWDGCEDASTLDCSDFPEVICLYDTHLLATSYEKLTLCHAFSVSHNIAR
jgi:hypothetical protein